MSSIFKYLVIVSIAVLTGCAGFKGKAEPEVGEPKREVLPFDSPAAPVEELSAEIVFNALMAGVAVQRENLPIAHHYEMEVALLAGDAKAAERATRIALQMKQSGLALKGAAEWVRLDPNDLSARQLLVMLMLQADADADVIEHLKAIVEIGRAAGDSGFLSATAAVGRSLGGDEAVALMRRLVSEFPKDPWGRYALALTAMMHNNYEVAEAEAKGLIEERPEWIKAYLVLSRIYVARKDVISARSLLAKAVDQFPEEPLLLSAYGRLLVDAKELDKAYEYFRKLLKIEPDGETVNYWLGVLSLEKERGDEAKSYFLKLIELGKRGDLAAYFIGRIEEGDSRSEDALTWYRKVEQGEFFHDAQIRIVRLLIQAGSLDESRDWLQGLRVRMPDQAVRFYLLEAEILREQALYKEAAALYDEALLAYTDNEDLLYARALFSIGQGRLDILERDLGRLLEINPEHADALNALGYTLADKTERYEEALRLLNRAMELKPDAPAILDSMGWLQFRMGNYQKALDYLGRAFKELKDGEVAAHYGEALWVTGSREAARAAWQAVLEKSPEDKYITETMRRLDALE